MPIIAWVIGKLLRAGVPGRFAGAVFYAGAIATALLALKLGLWWHDHSVIKAHDAKLVVASEKVQETNNQASNAASAALNGALQNISTEQKERDNAIKQAPASNISPAECQLNLERLRAAGYREADLPTCTAARLPR